jgi:putative NIF3 family GTP cyclohydrolase 1 type 2
MAGAKPSLRDLANQIGVVLDAAQDDVPLVWRDRDAPVQRFVLALDPEDLRPGSDVDAVFLHRPFGLRTQDLPGTGVLASHQGFDGALTTGLNRPLAECLRLENVSALVTDDRTVGMTGDLPRETSWLQWEATVEEAFGGLDASLPHGRTALSRVAFSNLMNEQAVSQAARLGAEAFVTGQVRVPGLAPAERLGLGILTVGHRRAESRGLRFLADHLRAVCPDLTITVAE